MIVAELPAVGEPLRLVERPVPEPGPGEVRVRVQACGVCGSDLFLQSGGFGVPLPVVPGHEAAGVVDALGPDVAGVAEGDQVALWYIDAPADSRYAAMGRPNVGPGVVRMGVDVDGAFAEYVVRPARTLVPTPAPVDPATLAALTDAVGTPYHALAKIAMAGYAGRVGRLHLARARRARQPRLHSRGHRRGDRPLLDGAIRTEHLTRTIRPLAEANEALDDLRAGRVLRSVLVP